MMRKIVFTAAILVLILIAAAAAWVWRGRDLALLSERFGTIEIRSEPIKSLSYEGNGSGGVLHIDNFGLDLTPAKSSEPVPEVGTSKDGQVALSYRGKVFAFGKPNTSDEKLATTPASGDEAKMATQRSIVTWPNPFEVNFMTGQSPSWKRFLYRRLTWTRADGAKLEMMWRCEQFLYPHNDWSEACMTDPGFTGLIRVEITSTS